MPRAAREVIRIGCRPLKASMSIRRGKKMPSKMRHGVLISLVVISLIVISFNTSYAETTNYTYDELNRLIQVIYEDGRGVIYTYDASGNRITLASYPDTVPPTGTITINSGATITCNPSITLTLTCSDNIGCSQMQFSNDNVTYSTPEAYATTKSWTLSPGDGTKTVYAKFKDVAGNWSTAYSDTIELLTADSYTKSLLHMNGTDGSTTFTDSAAGGTHTWTASGNAQIDTAQSKFGGASGLFDGTGDYIYTNDSADWNFGSGDWTIEFWMKLNVTNTYQTMFSQCQNSNNRQQVYYYGGLNGSIRFIARNTSGIITYFYTGPWTPGTNWHHIVIERNGNTPLIFIDGVSQTVTEHTTISGKTLPDYSAQLHIGWSNDAAYPYYFNGWLDEYRISKGIARWTSNFMPPTDQYCP
jgi:YD repeat-containing protein